METAPCSRCGPRRVVAAIAQNALVSGCCLILATSCTGDRAGGDDRGAVRVPRAAEPDRLTLQIVPTMYSNPASSEAQVSFGHGPLQVLLTNTSRAPVALFEEWNSWGYYCLSFVLTYPDGRTVRAVKRPRTWEKNFPSTVTIAPGGSYTFQVDFDPKTWQHSPLVEKRTDQGSIRCRMRAQYTIAPIHSSIKKLMFTTEKGVSVWAGNIASTERPYTLWP